jgi:gliding motility-associated-like protein
MRSVVLIILIFTLGFNGKTQNVSLQWATAFGGWANDYGRAIAVDGQGNVYVTGQFAETVDFDPGPGVNNITSYSHFDIFVSKSDKNGNFIWAKTVGGDGADGGNAIAIDSKGNVVYTAYFPEPVDVDPGPGVDSFFTGGFYNGFGTYISSLDADGNFLWAKQIPTTNSFVLDPSDNIVLVGQFVGLTDFDIGPGVFNLNSVPATGTQTFTTDVFVLKLDKTGNFLWAKAMGGGGYEYGMSVSVDKEGNIITTGVYHETADFDPGSGVYNLVSQGWTDVFVSKLDASGNFLWAKSLGGGEEDFSRAVVTNDKGDIYVAGYLYGPGGDFDPGPGVFNLTVNGYAADIFLTKLDASGNFIWAKSFGSTDDDMGLALALDVGGNIYITGGFKRTVDFDPGPGVYNVTSNGYEDIFILKLDPDANFFWCVGVGSVINYDFGAAITVDASGYVYTTGHFWGTVDFDPGPGQFNLTMNNTGDVFIQKLVQCPLVSYETINVFACNSYLLNGQTYTRSGTYRQVLTNKSNCDSIITLKLTVGGYASKDTVSGCDSYTWQGKTYTASGDYSAHYTTAGGCDSVFNLHLTIRNKVIQTIDTALCEGQNYLGYSATGVYSDTFHSANSCDSIRVLKLNIKSRSYSNFNITICEGESFWGHSNSGTYTDVLTAANGCDSIRTLYLAVNPKKITTKNVSICQGEHYYVQHADQTISGVYKDTLRSSTGCDSIIVTNLIINPKPTPALGKDIDLCERSSVTLSPGNFVHYSWQDQSNGATFLAQTTGVYFVTVTDQNNCSASDTMVIKNMLSPPANFLKPVDSICVYERLPVSSLKPYSSYLWSTGSTAAGIVVDKPGNYQLEVRDLNGCVGKETITIYPRDCITGFYVPTAFSPNYDGRNDVFRPLLFGNVKKYQFTVYNRWGHVVFQTSELNKAWDGTVAGLTQESNVFVWLCTFQFEGEEVKTERGTVMLVR